MPLIDITTDLKSLKYGDFGTQAPLITKSVLNPPNSKGLSMEFERRKDDLVRIGKLLATGPGLKHLGNQAALNIIEKNISSRFDSKTAAGRVLGGLGSTATSVASTLAQVPVNGTGTHFVEGFAGKRGYLPQIQGHALSRRGSTVVIDTSAHLDDDGNLINVSSSIFENTDDLDSKGQILTAFSSSKHSNVPLAYYTKDEAITSAKKNYGVGSRGFIDQASSADGDAVDVINIAAPNTFKLNQSPDEIEVKNLIDQDLQEVFDGDIIKFSFAIITPQVGSEDQPIVTPLVFRAYLDSFSDSFNSNWNSFKYIGRAEDFYSYEGFARTIQLSFKIAASSPLELEPLIYKLNLLAGSTAPTYTKGSYMRGNFTSVTVGDYLNKQPGIINSVDITWNTDYPWQTSLNERGSGKELPMVLDVSVSFTPVHTSAPNALETFIGKDNVLLTGVKQNNSSNE